MKNEYKLNGDKILRLVANPLDDDIALHLEVTERGKSNFHLFTGTAEEIGGLICFLDECLAGIKELESLYKRGWRN